MTIRIARRTIRLHIENRFRKKLPFNNMKTLRGTAVETNNQGRFRFEFRSIVFQCQNRCAFESR